MQSMIDRPQVKTRGAIGWKRVRRPLLSSCAAAAMLISASQPRPARAQAFQATGMVQSGPATITTGTNTTNIAIGGSGNVQAVITWVPNTTALAGTGNIAFMPTSVANPTTATFAGAPGVTNFTVLNNVVPTTTADQMRAIAIDGTIQSTIIPTPGVPAVRGGNVWFYSPGGIVVGGSAIFNVGGLLLTSSAVNTAGGLYGNGPASGPAGGSIRLTSPTDSTRAVIIQPGAQINANVAQNSYVALVAPRVTQGGTVTVKGSAAYVAAEAANLNFSTDGGLVGVSVSIGSHTDGTAADGVTLTHTGTTTGPASTGATDAHDIFFVALPKNNAVTMLLSGTIGYQAAVSAGVENGAIVLGAGSSVDNAFAAPESTYSGVPSATFNGNIDIAGGTFTSDVTGFYTGNGTASSRLGDLHFTQDLNLFPSQGSGALGDSTVAAINGNDITIDGNLYLRSVAGRISQASANSGSTLTVGGSTLIFADQTGNSETGYGPYQPATNGTGGTALLTANGGDIVLAAVTLRANGVGGSGNALAGGIGTGGTATVTSQGGGTIQVSGAAIVSANGTGGASNSATGGAGTGGNASVVTQGGTATFAGPSLTISADGTGGSGVTGGVGTGNIAKIDANDSAITLTAAAATTDLFARGTGGAGTATGGNGTAGTASLLVTNTSFGTQGAVTLTGTGTGGAGPAAGAGAGNQIYITSTGGQISSTASITADGRGYGGSNAGTTGAALGGTGTGGTINVQFSPDGEQATLSTPLLAANADGIGSGAGCGQCTSAYGAGAGGTGGTIDVQLQGGPFSATTLTLSAIGTGGTGRRSSEGATTDGFGGDGNGGTIDFTKQYGDLSLGTVTLNASGVGGGGGTVLETGYGSTGVGGGTGGAGGGGIIDLVVNGGGDVTGTLSLIANGTGGVGGTGQTGAGGAGGAAYGGDADLDPSVFIPGTVTINSLVATSNALGGAGGTSVAGNGGAGGLAHGGEASVVASGANASYHFLNTVTITANQTGGAGGASTNGAGGNGGNGGYHLATSARIEASGSDASMVFDGATVVRTDSIGGAGGASGSGNGGVGGSGVGTDSTASILASGDGSSLTFNDGTTVSATTLGGAGGATQTGALGGAGGYGDGYEEEEGESTATVLATNGTLNFNAPLTLDVHAIGGAGGAGGSTSGGKGGGAYAGYASLSTLDEDDVGTINFSSLTVAATALGGAGGAGKSFVETGPGAIPAGTSRNGGAGGFGGDAVGGSSAVSTRGGTLTGGSVSSDVRGLGGAGADGGTGAGYAAGAPAAGGIGGDGGKGFGGTIALTSEGGRGDLDDVTLTADGQGGRGGNGSFGGTTPAVPPMPGNPGTPGSPAIPGAQADGGAGGQGNGGAVTIAVSDLADLNADPQVFIDGRLSLGDTTISANGNGGFYGTGGIYGGGGYVGFPRAGLVLISDSGEAANSLTFSELDSNNTGFSDSDGDFTLSASNGPITVTNSAYVYAQSVLIDATGSGTLNVGGELSINGYNGIHITHANPAGDTIHAGNIDAFSYGTFAADAGTVLRSDDNISINAYSGLNAAELHAQNQVYGHTQNPGADIDIGIATADGPVDTGYGVFGAPPAGSAVTFIAGDDDPFVAANVNIHDTVSATGSVLLRAGGDVVVDAGATVTSDNSVQIDAGNNVRISGTVTAAADPLPDYSLDTDPETSHTSSLDITAGTLFTQGDRNGLILVDGSIAAPGQAVRLLGAAIQVDNTIDARSLIAGIHDAPALGSAPDNQGGLLRAGCEVGNICLGPLLTTRVVEIGGASGTTDTLPNQVTLTGGFGGFTSSVRADGDIILGSLSSPTVYSGTSLLHIESVQGSDTFLGQTTLRSGSGYSYSYHGNIEILAAGDVIGSGTAIDSDQDVAFHAGGDLSLASLTFGGHLNTLDSGGATTATDDLIVPGAVSISDFLNAGDNVRIDAGTSISIGQVTASDGAATLNAGTTATLGDVSAKTTLDIVAPDGISAGQVAAGDRVQLTAAQGPISATGLIASGPNSATGFAGNAFINANGAVNLGTVDVYSYAGLTSQTSDVSVSGNITATNIAILAAGNVSAGNVYTNLFYVGSPSAAQTVYGPGYVFGQTAALTPNVDALIAGGVTRAGGDVDVTGNLAAGRIMIGAGRDISLTRDEGLTRGPNAITDALTLDAGRDVTASGNFTATQATITAGRDIKLANLRLFDSGSFDAGGDIDAEQLDIAGTLSATGSNVKLSAIAPLHVTSATASGGALTITGSDLQLDGATAQTAIDIELNGNAGLAGDISAPAISISSTDIAIDPAARIGIDTDSITLTNVAGSRTYVGGAGSTNGWSLSNEEFGRLSAHTITINAQPVEDVYALEIGQLDVIGSAGADTASRRQNLTGSNLVFNAAGSALVDGAVSLTGAGADDTLTINATDQLNVITPGGSIALSGQNGALGGTLNLTADTIFVGSQQALTDLAASTSFGARNTRLDTNDGAVNAAGSIQANGLVLTGGKSIYIQNSGTTASPDTRAGFTVGSGGVTLVAAGQTPTEVVINGRQTSATAAGGFVTGAALIPLITQPGPTSESSLAKGSTANSCLLTGAPCGVRVTVPVIPPVQDVINTRLDPSAQLAFLVNLPLIELSDVVSVGLEPLIDDPVTGAGNEDMWLGSSDLDDEHKKDKSKARGTAD